EKDIEFTIIKNNNEGESAIIVTEETETQNTILEIESNENERTLVIPISSEDNHIAIVGTKVVPEFPIGTMIIIISTISGMIIIATLKRNLFMQS
ncbi:MAG TPA: hypothetical protein VGA92_01650, partial [Candidatus Nitrosotenuis sp.]